MLNMVITLIVVGIGLWAVNTYLPLDEKIKQLLNIAVVICVVVWLLSMFGVIPKVNTIGVPQVR